MARIKGVDIPNEKQVETSITYIYGIGRNLARKLDYVMKYLSM